MCAEKNYCQLPTPLNPNIGMVWNGSKEFGWLYWIKSTFSFFIFIRIGHPNSSKPLRPNRAKFLIFFISTLTTFSSDRVRRSVGIMGSVGNANSVTCIYLEFGGYSNIFHMEHLFLKMLVYPSYIVFSRKRPMSCLSTKKENKNDFYSFNTNLYLIFHIVI